MIIEELFTLLPSDRLEYHRNAVALFPETGDSDPGVAVLAFAANGARNRQIDLVCNCRASKAKRKSKPNCPHIKALSAAIKKCAPAKKPPATQQWLDATFRVSPWYQAAVVLHQACSVSRDALQVETGKTVGSEAGEGGLLRILQADGEPLVTYRHAGGETRLLLERTSLIAPDGDSLHRGQVFQKLCRITLTDTERQMHDKGMKNRRQALEESFWYRLFYHLGTVSAYNGGTLSTAIDTETGRFMIKWNDGAQRFADISVPRHAVMRVRAELAKVCQITPVLPQSMESIVKVSADKENNLKLILCLLLHLPDGSTEVFERGRLSRYWYNDAVYIPKHRVIATWKAPDTFARMFKDRYTKRIKQDLLPEVIEKAGDIFAPPNIVDPSVTRLNIHRECSWVGIDPSALDRDWCWLSIHYGFGENASVSLSEIYKARVAGEKYIPVEDGWVDVRAVGRIVDQPGSTISGQLVAGREILRLSRRDLFQLRASVDGPLRVKGEIHSQAMQAILEMQPVRPLGELSGMTGNLRHYQQNGVQWLAFLHENRLGGLLCDEMGLGKTHQVMALLVWLSENRENAMPALVVCPTTVISHWERKIRDHAPTLHPCVFHGTDREIGDISAPGTVLITSYGVLLRETGRLGRFRFSLAAFDEAHVIKNPDTQSHAAAREINADLKIAVTGTPIENRLGDLRSLMDLVLPGYLGSEHDFRHRFELGGKGCRAELRRLVQPFTLRRIKSAVLDELPDKIEDIRYCTLTETQVRLYREAIAGRGKQVLEQLGRAGETIPYIHIFALLTLLKQICNHPASVSGTPGLDETGPDTDTDTGTGTGTLASPGKPTLDSGKWEVFEELLASCLESGQKVVVFSQFVPMVNLILAHLAEKGVQAASITGQTRNRGREIDRFNNDPDCRVFVGSLKAGGSGIDLIGGSVVIHYDRWWNAAKEDQATDRVHRIGQTRGVQVFKLVTEGTLEEKIAAIIDRKKDLMNNVIAEDDPGVLKSFSREELMDLIAMPGAVPDPEID